MRLTPDPLQHPSRHSGEPLPLAPGDPFDVVASRLRAMSIDNFSLTGNVVRIGSAEWRLSVCVCGFTGCDGWALEPMCTGYEFD